MAGVPEVVELLVGTLVGAAVTLGVADGLAVAEGLAGLTSGLGLLITVGVGIIFVSVVWNLPRSQTR